MPLIRVSAPLALVVLLLPGGAAAAEPQEVWRAEGFEQPESVAFDAERNVLYVSNVNGEMTEKDGQGYVSKLAPDGVVIEARWVMGLNAPKGLAVHGDRLYASDIDRLIAIDIAAGEVAETFDAPEAEFLNDVAVDGEGRVFVSDTGGNAIYALDGDSFEIWLEDEGLMGPNGLVAEEDRLIVAAWGEGEGSAGTPGHLKTVDYEAKTVESLGDGTPVGNLDGIEPDGEGKYLVTDRVAGALYRIRPSGAAERLLDLNQGSADLEYREGDGLALIPMMMDGTVSAYRVD